MIAVRHARPVDHDAWHRMRCDLWPDGGGRHETEIRAFFAGTRHEPAAVLIATGADGEPLGFAELSVRPYAEGCATDRVAYLEGWYVVPEARGKGVGRALIEGAEAWAVGRGCTELASDALRENGAGRAAHLAAGFEEVEQIHCFRKAVRGHGVRAPVMDPVATAPVIVRHATLADADAIAGLVTELGYPSSPEQMRARLTVVLPRSDFSTLVGIVEEEVAAFIGLTVRPSYTADGLQGQIVALAVSRRFRRRGAGRALVEAAESLLARRGATAVVVTTANHRADAHAFYENLGYAWTGRRYRKNVSAGAR